MRAIVTPFRFSATGAVASTDDIHQIVVQQIRDIVITAPGERTMRPRYGGGLANEVFEPLGSAEYADLADEIKQRCNEHLRLGVVAEVRVSHHDQPAYDIPINTLLVEVAYSIPPDTTTYTASYNVRGLITEET